MLFKIKTNYNYKMTLALMFIVSLFSISMINAQGIKRAGMEPDDYIEFEAESFNEQTNTSKREWKLMSKQITSKVRHDHDVNHSNGASKSKYLEILPDMLYEGKGSKVIGKKEAGKTYCNKPCNTAVLSYNVNFKSAGKYYVWIRGFSTSGHDNSIHVGIDGNWPDSGQKLYICEEKMNQWSWSSQQFGNSERCGSRERVFLEIERPGPHKVMFSMREDGFEFDKWVMTKKYTKTPI